LSQEQNQLQRQRQNTALHNNTQKANTKLTIKSYLKCITEVIKSSITKGKTIVNFQQINGQFASNEANTHKMSSSIDNPYPPFNTMLEACSSSIYISY